MNYEGLNSYFKIYPSYFDALTANHSGSWCRNQGTTITPAIINNSSSVNNLRKYVLEPNWTRGCSRSCRAGRGTRHCCLDLIDAERYTPRNTQYFQQLQAVTRHTIYGLNQDEVLT